MRALSGTMYGKVHQHITINSCTIDTAGDGRFDYKDAKPKNPSGPRQHWELRENGNNPEVSWFMIDALKYF